MRVTQRLYFAALPSVVGALAVAGLAYWGQYARAVPEVILAIAIFATVATLIMSWINVRYVARRVERLALTGGRSAGPMGSLRAQRAPSIGNAPHDELDTIESAVTQLNDAVQSAVDDRTRDVAYHDHRRRENAELLAMTAATGTRELDEVRMPLHILLENHFGELNENQEEMLGAARVAAERIADELSAMAELARLELGQVSLRKDRVFPADAVNAILPVIRSEAATRGIQLRIDIQPLVPAVQMDASRLQQALQVLLREAVTSMRPGVPASLTLADHDGATFVALSPAGALPASTQIMLARRTMETMGAELSETNDALRIRLPS